MEDSVIANLSSIQRGMLRSVFFRSYKDEESKKQNGIVEEFCKPNSIDVSGTKNNNYDNIDEDGLPKIGSVYNKSEVLVGKKIQVSTLANENSQDTKYLINNKSTHKDVSFFSRSSESGTVEDVILTMNPDGKKFTKVKMKSVRIPEIGDKISSRAGQKGTIGMTVCQEDMPYTREGITPDIIINPHCIPSRMTVSQLIECVSGKAIAMSGNMSMFDDDKNISLRNSTPFEDLNIEERCRILKEYGYESMGNEVLYDGRTGEKMSCMIFMGPTYYQRLKHLVADKKHSRNLGPLQNLVRQPTEG